MLRLTIRDLAWICFVPIAGFGQPAAPNRAFEVASIKPHEGPIRNFGVHTSGMRLTADAYNLGQLVVFAYGVKNFQVVGPPPLLNDSEARWDIVAKAEGESVPTRAEFRMMLQRLLAERFHLEIRRETRQMQVYALVVGKSGPKFKESGADADPIQHYGGQGSNNVITMPKAGMADVVDALGNAMLDHPVVDQTGLSGAYNIKLTFMSNSKGTATDPGDGIDVFQAVQEQLGLKLEARTAAVEMIVVERAEKPSGN